MIDRPFTWTRLVPNLVIDVCNEYLGQAAAFTQEMINTNEIESDVVSTWREHALSIQNPPKVARKIGARSSGKA